MVDIPDTEVTLSTYGKFETDVFTAIMKHYPGAVEGQTLPHASATAALTTMIAHMLLWRLVESEEAYVKALGTTMTMIDSAVRARFEVVMQMREELQARGTTYVDPGNTTKQ